MRFAAVGEFVFVGDWLACNERIHQFDKSIHIWQPVDWQKGRFCKRLHKSSLSMNGPGLCVRWLDGDPLCAMSERVEAVDEYVRGSDPLLIHSAGGICRSLTLAVVAKVVRGRPVFEAINDVQVASWTLFGKLPRFHHRVMEEVIKWSHLRWPHPD